jgi:hypothetical protein
LPVSVNQKKNQLRGKNCFLQVYSALVCLIQLKEDKMKVYKSYSPNLRDSKEVPQIKIKNDMLSNSGFEIGKEFAVIYQPGKITLVLVSKEN